MSPTILIVIHSLYAPDSTPISGTGASLFDLFAIKKTPFSCLHLPIYGNANVLLDRYNGGELFRTRLLRTPASLGVRTFIEAKTIFTLLVRNKHTQLYLGIDPLNALWGILGKLLLRNVDHVIYYTADYADQRFLNPIVNWIYHYIDRFCIKYADQIWNVSTRIYQKRLLQGVAKEKIFVIPNAPLYHRGGKNKHNKFHLVVVGTSTTSLNFSIVLDALPSLKKIYSRLILHIVGDLHFPVSMQKKLERLQAEDMLILHGPLSRLRVQKLLLQCGVGLALYIDRDPWTWYGDSMKMREYLCAGLPIITTSVVATSELVKENSCGVVIGPTVYEFIRAVRAVYRRGQFSQMQLRALAVAKKYSFDGLVRQPLSDIGITV